MSILSLDPLILNSLVALPSALAFAYASLHFKEVSLRASPLWMNSLKACVATICFFLAFLVSRLVEAEIFVWPEFKTLGFFGISGFLGLFIADTFLLKAFASIGIGRTLMIFSFNPIFLGLAGSVLFGQSLSDKNLWAIALLCLCVVVMAHESYLRERRWAAQGLMLAVAAGVFDALGIVLTRFAFENTPDVSVNFGNFIRCLGALVGFFVFSPFRRVSKFTKFFRSLEKPVLKKALLASFFGTYFSLSCWLWALGHGHIGITSALAGTAPLFATVIESLQLRKPPGLHLMAALIFFGLGFFFILV